MATSLSRAVRNNESKEKSKEPDNDAIRGKISPTIAVGIPVFSWPVTWGHIGIDFSLLAALQVFLLSGSFASRRLSQNNSIEVFFLDKFTVEQALPWLSWPAEIFTPPLVINVALLAFIGNHLVNNAMSAVVVAPVIDVILNKADALILCLIEYCGLCSCKIAVRLCSTKVPGGVRSRRVNVSAIAILLPGYSLCNTETNKNNKIHL